jgi:hypothetical protein
MCAASFLQTASSADDIQGLPNLTDEYLKPYVQAESEPNYNE